MSYPTLSPLIKTQTFSVKVPSQWQDQTTHIWSAPANSTYPIAPNIVSTNESLPTGQPFHAFVNQQMKELLNAGTDLTIEHKDTIEWNGKETMDLVFHWRSEGMKIKQRQLYIRYTPEHIVTLVFTAHYDDYDNHTATFEQIENSFNWE